MSNQTFSKIGIIVILVALIAGGFLAWQYFGIPKEEVTGEQTANWETYKNEEYKFEIKYPPEWEITQEVHLKEQAPTISSSEAAEIRGALQVGVNMRGDITLSSAKQVAEMDKSNPYYMKEIIREGKIIIGGVEGYEIIFITEYATGVGTERVAVQHIYLIHNNNLYEFSYNEQKRIDPYTWVKDYKEWTYGDVFNQMLSTFRFLE